MWNFLLFSYSPQGLEIKPKLRLLSSALTDLVSRLVLLGTLLLNCGGLNSCSLHDQPCLTTSPHAPCDPATQALPPVKEITHHSQDGPCAFITPCSCLFSSRPFHSFCISSFPAFRSLSKLCSHHLFEFLLTAADGICGFFCSHRCPPLQNPYAYPFLVVFTLHRYYFVPLLSDSRHLVHMPSTEALGKCWNESVMSPPYHVQEESSQGHIRIYPIILMCSHLSSWPQLQRIPQKPCSQEIMLVCNDDIVASG